MTYRDLHNINIMDDTYTDDDIIIYIDNEPYYVNELKLKGCKVILNAIPMICDTCKYCEKDIPHTCDVCTSLDEDEIGMWEERE